jgi:hypothetical protein
MELSHSWESVTRLAVQEFHNILWNPKVQYHINMSPPQLPVLGQINPVHDTSSYFSKIHYNTGSSKKKTGIIKNYHSKLLNMST